jgi:hypothetical protein
MSVAIFHRTDLAMRMSERILSTQSGNASSSGLFLAAPRRTGKSTFLREDLTPALEKAKAYVLYVDLWADQSGDPGDAIVKTVRAALSTFEGVLLRIARAAGLDKITLPTVAFSLDKIG